MSGPRIAAPPGRAGRLWLERRLRAARRGADLLDRKLRILQAELAGLAEAADLAEREWRDRAGAADRALIIASVLSGQRAIELAAGPGYADVAIGFTATVGVRRPAEATCTQPDRPLPWASPPVTQAREAHRVALEAAVRYAAAARALEVVQTEAAAARVRLRAIKDRLIPGLEQARNEVVLAIDELERADGARVRRAGLRTP
ncbi:MAG TPA: V-type ATP synthase subunit D [Streptosporangiaceae bacterium]|nr:V-type ATP synthase subunit D [Streptosporangiaceae bacterium]